tara:strand:- start:1434 stop:1682 length:249 start_codon:yes stop_codon:yes gene_type:complete
MSDKEETVEQPTQATAQATAPVATQEAGPDLTIQDLQGLKTIIDVASARGVFKPNEMVSVGQVYGKLEAFLTAVAAQQPKQG